MDSYARRELALRAASHAEDIRLKYKVARSAAVDPIFVAEERGCEVRFMALPSLEGVYSPNPRPVIVLGSQRPKGRRSFTCAHELGHHEFKHGAQVESLNAGHLKKHKAPDEYLADMFAAFLLMSQGSVRRALKDRRIRANKIEVLQVFRLSCYFGVGYSTVIDHLTWTLRLFSPLQRERLLQIKPSELKSNFGAEPQSDVVIVDELWRDRAVDLEIDDTLVIPKTATLEEGPNLSYQGTVDGQLTYRAASRGYARAFNEDTGWAINIRIASKHYQGLARYRFLSDPEEEIR